MHIIQCLSSEVPIGQEAQLSHRTARRTMSVKFLLIAEPLYEKSHLKRLAVSE